MSAFHHHLLAEEFIVVDNEHSITNFFHPDAGFQQNTGQTKCQGFSTIPLSNSTASNDLGVREYYAYINHNSMAEEQLLPCALYKTNRRKSAIRLHIYSRCLSQCFQENQVRLVMHGSGASVTQWLSAGLLANMPNDRSCAWGMIHNKIHLIRQGCPRPSIALQCRIVA